MFRFFPGLDTPVYRQLISVTVFTLFCFVATAQNPTLSSGGQTGTLSYTGRPW